MTERSSLCNMRGKPKLQKESFADGEGGRHCQVREPHTKFKRLRVSPHTSLAVQRKQKQSIPDELSDRIQSIPDELSDTKQTVQSSDNPMTIQRKQKESIPEEVSDTKQRIQSREISPAVQGKQKKSILEEVCDTKQTIQTPASPSSRIEFTSCNKFIA